MSCSPLFCCFALVMVCLMGGAQADSEFQLKVEISPQDLSVISSAGQQVTLVRTSQIGGPTRWSTVWASFSPFPNNLITWNNTGLSFYAAQALPTPNMRVVPNALSSELSSGLAYPFQAFGAFGIPFVPQFRLHPNEVALFNNVTQAYNFGIAADIEINNQFIPGTPISAEVLLGLEHQIFQPSDFVLIFLSQPLARGVATDQLQEIANSRITEVRFTSDNSRLVVTWDSANDRFVQSEGQQ